MNTGRGLDGDRGFLCKIALSGDRLVFVGAADDFLLLFVGEPHGERGLLARVAADCRDKAHMLCQGQEQADLLKGLATVVATEAADLYDFARIGPKIAVAAGIGVKLDFVNANDVVVLDELGQLAELVARGSAVAELIVGDEHLLGAVVTAIFGILDQEAALACNLITAVTREQNGAFPREHGANNQI